MNNISTGISCITGLYGLATIGSVLGIVITILSIINILINLGFNIYDKIKAKKYKEIPGDISKTIDDLKDLKEKNDGDNN